MQERMRIIVLKIEPSNNVNVIERDYEFAVSYPISENGRQD